MGASQDWQDTTYAETFEKELRWLERRRKADPNCSVEEIEGALKHLYIMDGADSGGRGALQDIINAATIAAYEQFIASWRSQPPT